MSNSSTSDSAAALASTTRLTSIETRPALGSTILGNVTRRATPGALYSTRPTRASVDAILDAAARWVTPAYPSPTDDDDDDDDDDEEDQSVVQSVRTEQWTRNESRGYSTGYTYGSRPIINNRFNRPNTAATSLGSPRTPPELNEDDSSYAHPPQLSTADHLPNRSTTRLTSTSALSLLASNLSEFNHHASTLYPQPAVGGGIIFDRALLNSRPQFRSKAVCQLSCKYCHNGVCNRGMKAILLADMAVELFSTDIPPSGVSLVNDDYQTRKCQCRIRDVACLGCGNVIGYHVTQPCQSCMEACNNGHFWMFHVDHVQSSERMNAASTKPLLWANLSRIEMERVDQYEGMCR